jgi:hypothetical protein
MPAEERIRAFVATPPRELANLDDVTPECFQALLAYLEYNAKALNEKDGEALEGVYVRAYVYIHTYIHIHE